MDKIKDNCGNCYWSEQTNYCKPHQVECRGTTPACIWEDGIAQGTWPVVDKVAWCRHHSRPPVGPISG